VTRSSSVTILRLLKLTMMVNNPNPYLAQVAGLKPPPTKVDATDAERWIGKASLWSLEDLQSLVERDTLSLQTVVLVTTKCLRDVARLKEEPGGFDLAQQVSKLRAGNYDKSLWCLSSPLGKAPGFWIPCDAYSLSVPFEHPNTGWKGEVNLYFKMAKAVSGLAVLFVSVHP